MLYNEIKDYPSINDTDIAKSHCLAQGMIRDGWIGCPIIIFHDALLTGSHRLAALKEVELMWFSGKLKHYPSVLCQDVALDLTEDIELHLADKNIGFIAPGIYMNPNGLIFKLSYFDIGWLLEGTPVEIYKKEIKEW